MSAQIGGVTPTPALVGAARRTSARDMLELTKPGIVRMVVVAAGVGFALSAMYRPAWSASGAVLGGLACLLGVGMCAAGANTLNQVMEVERDARMSRTKERPLPTGRVPVLRGLLFGLLLAFMGLSLVGIINGAAPAALTALTIALYALAYTPLKPVTTLSTVVGAIPGALPPVIGWTAAAAVSHAGLLDPGGWTLFALMFVWQVPHVLAISLKYRDDYAAAGHRVLPVVQGGEHVTGRAAVLWSLALVPVSLSPLLAMSGILGAAYALTAGIGGGAMVWASVRMARARTPQAATLLFIVSIVYIPLVMGAMVVDAALHTLA